MMLLHARVISSLGYSVDVAGGDWLGRAESAFTILAIIVGGLWAYYNFFKGRLYRTRLEPSISGSYVISRTGPCLVVTAKLRNAGVAKAEILQKGSGVRLSIHDASRQVPLPGLVYWKAGTMLSVFETHGWIESGETVCEDHLIRLADDGGTAFLLEMRIVSAKLAFRTNAVVVVPVPAPSTAGG